MRASLKGLASQPRKDLSEVGSAPQIRNLQPGAKASSSIIHFLITRTYTLFGACSDDRFVLMVAKDSFLKGLELLESNLKVLIRGEKDKHKKWITACDV